MVQGIVWGYARVSSSSQNPQRQREALLAYGINERNIKTDIQSGKDFNRREFLSLVGTETTAPAMRAGDCLAVQSLDRLGRNYEDIRKWWEYITNDLQCDIIVLDMPLLNSRERGSGNLDRKFIADLVLQILSYVSEKERLSIKERQAQGIAIALEQGKPYGRPRTAVPDNFAEVSEKWVRGEITAVSAMKSLGMSRSMFYARIREAGVVKS